MYPKVVLFLSAALALAACGDSATRTIEPEPEPPAALQPGRWMLTMADGQLLPALVAHRQVDGVLEQTFVDSAYLEIMSQGLYQQTVWTRTLRNGVLLTKGGLADAGTWRVEQSRYRFASAAGVRSLRVDNDVNEQLDVIEPMVVERAEAGLVHSQYRRAPNTPPNTSPNLPVMAPHWRAVDLSQSALPKTVSSYADEPARGNRTEIRFDGATLELLPSGRFMRRTYYSEWLSSDIAAGSPFQLRYRFSDYDHGTWTRHGDQIVLTSGWIQHQVVYGTVLPNGTIRVQHALTPGDFLMDVGYAPGQ